jgi:hypothetical protein
MELAISRERRKSFSKVGERPSTSGLQGRCEIELATRCEL